MSTDSSGLAKKVLRILRELFIKMGNDSTHKTQKEIFAIVDSLRIHHIKIGKGVD